MAQSSAVSVFELFNNYVTVRKSTKLKQWTVSLAKMDAEASQVNKLTRSEWAELKSNFDKILSLLETETFASFEIGTRRQTCSVEEYKGNVYVHIRQWWSPPSSDSTLPTKRAVPTRRGIMMQMAEFKDLVAKADDISAALPVYYAAAAE